MFLPYGSDAPIYHWPIGTIALIVVNVIVFCCQPMIPSVKTESRVDLSSQLEDHEFDAEDLDDIEFLEELIREIEDRKPGFLRLALSHGDGLHPVQWLTSFFLHADFMHLLGNMIFLWVFGLIVEGRIGLVLFLLLYVGIGVFQNFAEQLIFLWSTGYGESLGASSAIYGLMMIALLWSPKDHVLAIFSIGWFWFTTVRIPIAIMSALYFLADFTVAFFSGFELGTSMLHLMGAVVGFGVGAVCLWNNWVDCEQEDMLSMLREAWTGDATHPKSKVQSSKPLDAATVAEQERQREFRIKTLVHSIDSHIAAGNIEAADLAMRQLKRVDPNADWSQKQYLKLINVLQRQEKWDRVINLSTAYLKKYGEQAEVLRLNLAKIYLKIKGMPKRARRVLQQIDQGRLDEKQKHVFARLAKLATKMADEGYLDLIDDD